MEKKIDKDAFRGLVEASVLSLSHFSIGFALPVTIHGSIDAYSAGSGTLVTIDEIYGILTASHVTKNLMKYDDVGLILSSPNQSQLHNLSFRSEMLREYSFSNEEQPRDGPDLSLIIPPPPALSALKATKSFYNLSQRQSRMLERPEAIQNGFWILSGIVSERTSDASPEGGFTKVKIFRGMHGAGSVTKEFDQGDFDYLVFEALYNEFYEGPESYEGMSGGGLWQVVVKPNGDKLVVSEYLLSGVAFYQSGKKQNDEGEVVREVICHGRRSLYQSLIDKVHAATKRT